MKVKATFLSIGVFTKIDVSFVRKLRRTEVYFVSNMLNFQSIKEYAGVCWPLSTIQIVVQLKNFKFGSFQMTLRPIFYINWLQQFSTEGRSCFSNGSFILEK